MQHMLKSHIKDAEAVDKAEGSGYMPHRMSQDLKDLVKDKSGHSPGVIKVALLFCVMEELRKTIH